MEFLLLDWLGNPAWMWLGFVSIVGVLLALDLGVFHRVAHVVKFREALGWTALWFTLAMAFAGLIKANRPQGEAIEFVTGYIVELSLSMDNVFVIALIFSTLGIPRQYQHRVLFWGILGVIVLRALSVLASLLQYYGFTLSGAYGTGFKAPSVSQAACDFCFAAIPFPALRPEKAEGYEAAIGWRSADGRIEGRATAYHLGVEDQITYFFDTVTFDSYYINLARTRSTGLELQGDLAL